MKIGLELPGQIYIPLTDTTAWTTPIKIPPNNSVGGWCWIPTKRGLHYSMNILSGQKKKMMACQIYF
jgi:hypothetical protein